MSTSSSSSQRRKRVYTKYGDQGETSLLYGGRVSKANPHTEAYGITDEAVSLMGLARALTDDDKVKNILRDLQRELFTVAAELATDPEKYDLFHQHFTPVTEQMVDNLEETIDELETHFQMPQVFHPARRERHHRRPWTRRARSSAPPSAAWSRWPRSTA